jgi:hypothetical protein
MVTWMLAQEARDLLTRPVRVKPFALLMPMIPAAAISPAVQMAIASGVTRWQLADQVGDRDYPLLPSRAALFAAFSSSRTSRAATCP